MTIDSFSGQYAFLSNFYVAPFQAIDSMALEGRTWRTTEHFFQAMKNMVPANREAIRLADTARAAKNLGISRTFTKLRSNWLEIRVDVMRYALRRKFACNPKLAKKLLATGDRELIEGNIWGDRFWGVCDGEGKNMLGKLLMELRTELR